MAVAHRRVSRYQSTADTAVAHCYGSVAGFLVCRARLRRGEPWHTWDTVIVVCAGSRRSPTRQSRFGDGALKPAALWSFAGEAR